MHPTGCERVIMKDFDKIKEKDKKDEFKGILGLGLIFLIAVGVIVYILINLTNQYFSLKNQLDESKEEKKIATTVPEEGPVYEYKVSESTKKIEKVEKTKVNEEKRTETTSKANDDISNVKNVTAQQTKKPKQTVTEDKNLKISEKQKANDKNKKTDKKSLTDKNIGKEKKEKIVKKKTPEKHVSTKRTNYPYAVQLMAFKNKTDANNQLKKFKKYIDDVYVVKADLGKKGIWYRLRCCKSENKNKALNKSKEINKKLNLKSIVVRN